MLSEYLYFYFLQKEILMGISCNFDTGFVNVIRYIKCKKVVTYCFAF